MMDIEVIGRRADDERATLEELSGAPVAVGRLGRRWLIALAGIVAIACVGFAGTLAPSGTTGPDTAALAVSSQATVPVATPSHAPSTPRPAIAPFQPRPDESVIGSVSVQILATSGSRVDVSITDGGTLVHWDNVRVGADGQWIGTAAVVTAQVPLPAEVRVGGPGVEAGR
jgi:hypothetical protein